MDRLKDKVVLVTGAALGIGRAICLLFAKEGAHVAISDVNDEAGREVAYAINQDGGRSAFWHLDVTSAENVKEVFADVSSAFGNITTVVNNAWISGTNKPTDEITEEEWDQVMSVNVKGVFLCTKYAIPALRKAGGGSIINLSSIYGLVGAADLPPYHASKGAVRLMTKNDALFYALEGIRVNLIYPGFIWTPLVEHFLQENGGDIKQAKLDLAARHPLNRLGEPLDVAYGALHLASDESKFVTGSELVIDGGYTCR